jgi:two-component system NarL family sensor kinase
LKFNLVLFYSFILCFFVPKLNAQNTSYILEEDANTFSTIEEQLEEENMDSVIILCDHILNQTTDLKTKGIAYFYLGQAEMVLDENGIASSIFMKCIDLFKKVDFEKGLAMGYRKNADVYFFQNDFQMADSLYDLSIGHARPLKLNAVLADAFQKKASIYTQQQNSEEEFKMLKEAFKYAQLKNDTDQSKDIITQISTGYHSEGQLDSAILYYKKVIELKQKIRDEDGLISDYSALGNLFRERGDYKESQENLVEALKLAEAEKDTFAITTIFSELGDINAAQNIWETAETYYNDALTLAKLKNSRLAEAGCYNKLGDLFNFQNNEDAARASYEASLKIYQQLNSKINTANVLISLSQMYKDGDQFTKAKSLLLEALDVRKNSKDVLGTLTTKMALAEIEIGYGKVSKGIVYAEECLSVFETMDDKEGLRKVYLLLSEAYAESGNYKKAYQFHLNYSKLDNSLSSIETMEAIKDYDLLYNTEKKDKEIAQQNEKLQAQEVEILTKNNQLLMLAGGIGLLGLLAALIFFIYLKNKQVNQQKIAVLRKEKQTQALKSVIEGEEKERKRFARELHDGLGAVLATVKMQISGIRHKIPQADSMPAYQKAESLIDDACRTVREISHDLMPHVLEQQGLVFAINEMCQTLKNHHNIEFYFIPFGDDEQLENVVKITIYRITQELLKNIIKHAEAKEVIVQLTIEDNEIILIVEDDGKGFDASTAQNGIGLENIRSRTAYLNGTLAIDSSINQGSTFTIQIPINIEQNNKS